MEIGSFVSDNFWRKIIEKEINKIPQNLITALNKLYKDAWDIDVEGLIENIKKNKSYKSIKDFNNWYYCERSFYIPIIIKLGDIQISNGKNKHTITDLYVKLILKTFVHDCIYYNLMGIRTSATLEELTAEYFHSHLPGAYEEFQTFCLGSNVDIKNSFYCISNPESTVEDFLLMLFTIKQSLSWESISGTPYKYLERIGKTPLEQDIPEYVPKDLLNRLYFTNLKFKITNNNIQILHTPGLEQQIFEQIRPTNYNTYTCYKTEFGEYLSNTHFSSSGDYYVRKWKDKDMFVFKGEMLKFKINNLIQKDYAENNAPNPKLTAGIIKELSNAITKKHIVNSRIKREDIVESSKECSEADSVPVLQYS